MVALTADQAGNSNYLAAATVTNSFTVNPAIPVVGSSTVSNIYAHAAMLGGTVTTTNGATILERGVYVSLTNGFDPQTGKKFSESGSFGEVAYSVYGQQLDRRHDALLYSFLHVIALEKATAVNHPS